VITKLCYVGAGGFLGAIARYLVGGWAAGKFGTSFPWGTFIINVSGSFLLGLITTLLTERFLGHGNIRLLIPIGFIGAYTTFSTFELETFNLASQGSLMLALLNAVGSFTIGFIALWLGVTLGRSL
jgi:CrcB protein